MIDDKSEPAAGAMNLLSHNNRFIHLEQAAVVLVGFHVVNRGCSGWRRLGGHWLPNQLVQQEEEPAFQGSRITAGRWAFLVLTFGTRRRLGRLPVNDAEGVGNIVTILDPKPSTVCILQRLTFRAFPLDVRGRTEGLSLHQ